MAIRNMSVAAFKNATGSTSFNFLKNPKTQKLFAASDTGEYFKVEGAIDFSKEIVILIEDNDLDTACFINKRDTVAVLHTL